MSSNGEEVNGFGDNVLGDGANGMAFKDNQKPEFKLNIKKEIDYINQFVREELKEMVFKRLFDCFRSGEPFILEQEILNALDAKRAEAEQKMRALEKNPYPDSEKLKMVGQEPGMDWAKAITTDDYEAETKDEIVLRDIGEVMSFVDEKKPSTDSEKMKMAGEESGSGHDLRSDEDQSKDNEANRRSWIDSPDFENELMLEDLVEALKLAKERDPHHLQAEAQELGDQWDIRFYDNEDKSSRRSVLTGPSATQNQPEELSLDETLLVASEKKKALQKTPVVSQKQPANDWTDAMSQYDEEDKARDRKNRNRFLIDPPVSNMLLDNWPMAQMRLEKFREKNDIGADVLRLGPNMGMGCPTKRRIYELKKKEPALECGYSPEFRLAQDGAGKPTDPELKTMSYVEDLLRDAEEFKDIDPEAKILSYLEGMEREAEELKKREPQSKLLGFTEGMFRDLEQLRKREQEEQVQRDLEARKREAEAQELEEYFKAAELKRKSEPQSTMLSFTEGMFRDLAELRRREQVAQASKDSGSKKREEQRKKKPQKPIPKDNGDGDAAVEKASRPKDDYCYNMYGIFAMAGSKLTPCYNINDIHGFSTEIREAMRNHIIGHNRAYGMQRFSWPHIASGKSLIVVGHELSGKTLSFLPQVCHVALQEMETRPEDDQGPTGIIICQSQASGRQIAAWIDQLMAGCVKKKRANYETLVTLWERGNVASAAYSLSHTVGILLTTAEMMLQLKEYHSSAAPILQARTVKCVALDNFGELVRLQPVTTVKLINWFAQNYNFNGTRKNPCQLFATGRLWDEQMHPNILHHVANTLIVFEDALEATVFKDVNVEMVEVPEKSASDRFLVEMLAEINLQANRTVVVCQTQSEAIHLRQEIGKARINALACYQESTGMPLVAQWRGCQDTSVLIVTDDILPKVRSGPVDILIHYNAASTWSRFKSRFTLFYDSYVAKRDPPGKSFVLVRRSETDYIWLMCDFMLKHHYVRPTGWIHVLFEHRLAMEKENGYLVGVPLCRQLTCFGDCFRRKCRYRHIRWIGEKSSLPDIDIKEGDAIRFQVLTVSSDSHLVDFHLNLLLNSRPFFVAV